MKRNLHQKFVDSLRIPQKPSKSAPKVELGSSEEELMRELEKKFDELFGSIDDDD